MAAMAPPLAPAPGAAEAAQPGEDAAPEDRQTRRDMAQFAVLSGQVVVLHAMSAACTERVFIDKSFHSPIFFQLVESTFNLVLQIITRIVRFSAAHRNYHSAAKRRDHGGGGDDGGHDVEGDAATGAALGHGAAAGARARRAAHGSAPTTASQLGAKPKVAVAAHGPPPALNLWGGFTFGHFLVGFGTVVSHGLSYIGYHELNYTTATLLKSGKVVTVMLLGLFVNGRRFTARAAVLAGTLCAGLSVFGLADKTSEAPKFSVWGLVACLLSLVGSAVCSNLQDVLLKKERPAASAPAPAPALGMHPPHGAGGGASAPPHAPSVTSAKDDLLLYQNAVTTALALVYCALTGDLRLGAAFLTTGSRGAVLATFGSVTFVYIGMYPLLQIVQTFDATQAQVVTSLRKAVTFVASFVLYPKPFTFMHFVGLLFSLAGAYYLEKELMHGKPGGKVSESPAPPSSSPDDGRSAHGGR